MALKNVKNTIYLRFYAVISKLNLARLCKIKKDARPVSPFKLVFFCGKTGTEYLNASLVSIYKCWDTIPEVIIISDGTPKDVIEKKLIKWPQKLEILSWEFCGNYFKENSNSNLYDYAAKDVWGKKLVGICYCAEKYPILYSDTDILWYDPPVLENISDRSFVKMCLDVDHYYSEPLLTAIDELAILKTPPLNAGLIYANGKFSPFPKWETLCNYLALNPDHRTEQTSFAVLNNYFNAKDYFKQEEIFIQIDDMYSFKYTKKSNSKIWARHYVNLKNTSFWRDFVYLLMGK